MNPYVILLIHVRIFFMFIYTTIKDLSDIPEIIDNISVLSGRYL